jgi:hypothetical protein
MRERIHFWEQIIYTLSQLFYVSLPLLCKFQHENDFISTLLDAKWLFGPEMINKRRFLLLFLIWRRGGKTEKDLLHKYIIK